MNTTIAEAIKEEGIETYLKNQQHKSLLRFLTCGSVDDGKSTLIGRLLHDSRQVYEDHLNTLKFYEKWQMNFLMVVQKQNCLQMKCKYINLVS